MIFQITGVLLRTTKLSSSIRFVQNLGQAQKFCSANLFKTSAHLRLLLNCRRFCRMGGNYAKEDLVEVYACKVTDMKDGEMKEIAVGDSTVLLVKDQDKFSAIGPKCTHYGAPLVKGVYKNGHVRCPWHGACFSTKTGDIEDFPGLDCVQKHEAYIQDDKVMIKTTKAKLENKKRLHSMTTTIDESGPHILIIGGGPTSVTCAETLRQKSFNGRITIATMESYLPYDRYV